MAHSHHPPNVFRKRYLLHPLSLSLPSLFLIKLNFELFSTTTVGETTIVDDQS